MIRVAGATRRTARRSRHTAHGARHRPGRTHRYRGEVLHHVAQINIGTLVAPTDHPRVAEFVGSLDRINAAADRAPGFVWRLQTEEGNATSIQVFDDPLTLLNVSVWESVESLKQYVYRTEHVEFFRRRAEWFVPGESRTALWHVAVGARPELDDAVRRADFLSARGPSPYAFGFARPPAPLTFEATDLDDVETAAMVARLNAELASVATEPGELHHDLDTAEITGDAGRMLRARLDGEVVACGAVRRIAPATGEIKRMFVDPDVRGRRVGAAILDQLELAAARLGITELRLETGIHQPTAQAMYETAGYAPIPLWGAYVRSPATSRCYAKSLT